MTYSFTMDSDEDGVLVEVSYPHEDRIPFSVRLGIDFEDPLASFLSELSDWTLHDRVAAWVNAAQWLAAEMKLVNELVSNHAAYSSAIQATMPYATKPEGIAKLAIAKQEALDPLSSKIDGFNALSEAAWIQRDNLKRDDADRRYRNYLQFITDATSSFGLFDFPHYTAVPRSVEFQSRLGAVVVEIHSTHIHIIPAGKAGTAIRTEKGSFILFGDIFYFGRRLTLGNFGEQDVYKKGDNYDDSYARTVITEIAADFLSENAVIDNALRLAGKTLKLATAWAKKVMNDRLVFFLQEEALKTLAGEPIPVEVDDHDLIVTPHANGTSKVEFAFPGFIRIDGDNFFSMGFYAEVVPLDDGQYGVAQWRGEASLPGTENEITRAARLIAIKAVKSVTEAKGPNPFETGRVRAYSASLDENNTEQGIKVLGLAKTANRISSEATPASLQTLKSSEGTGWVYPLIVGQADAEMHGQDITITSIALIETRYGLKIAELEHNYFMLRDLNLSLTSAVEIMVSQLGMTPPSNQISFYADIRTIRRLLKAGKHLPAEPNRLLDLARAKALKFRFQKAAKAKFIKLEKRDFVSARTLQFRTVPPTLNEIRKHNSKQMKARLAKLHAKGKDKIKGEDQ